METLTEAEIQVLIAVIELQRPIETPNNSHYTFYPKNLVEARTYFLKSLLDWEDAYPGLCEKGLLARTTGDYTLTEAGECEAARLRRDRPPIYYWYTDFYIVTQNSPANDLLCEHLFGKNLNQQGFMDMEQLAKLLEVTRIGPGSRVLDLGCGSGQISEYISGISGAFVSGMDYIAAAILQAQQRTRTKSDRLEFKLGNLDHLEYPPASFDTILAIDTLYMPNDLVDTLKQMKTILAPGGQMAIYYSYATWEDPQHLKEHLLPEHTPVAEALTQVGLSFKTWDFTQADYQHAVLKKKVAEKLRSAFEAEGNLFLYEMRMGEANGVSGAILSGNAVRYLYHVLL
jgi:ubiquinone/menaquinone biosynthesis C-methylase UbiE